MSDCDVSAMEEYMAQPDLRESTPSEITLEARIAELEGTADFWRRLHDLVDARHKDLFKAFNDVCEMSRKYDSKIIAANEMRTYAVIHERERNDAIERIAIIPGIASLTRHTRKDTGQCLTYIDTEKSYYTMEAAEGLAIAMDVLAQIGREWEAEAAKEAGEK